MSLLDFILEPEQIIILTDALATATDSDDLFFTTKVFPLPHFGGVLCGTGCLDFILEWFLFLETRMRARDFDFINDNCSAPLRDLWKKYESNPKMTATIYHFAFSPSAHRMKGHAFRSPKGFEKEELIDGVGYKPEGEKALEYLKEYMLAHEGNIDMVEIAKYQKQLDDELSPAEKAGIGGALHVCILNDRLQMVWQCFKFDDYERLFGLMLSNLNRH
jgi:hypothetical protein